MFSQSITRATLATTLWPTDAAQTWLRGSILAVCGSLLVALSAQVQVPLWPVPVTGQTFAVLVVGMAFGWRLGAATLLLYAMEGALGLPVFAQFSGGPAVLAGPTGGFIAGFVLAAALVGYLAERGWDRSVPLTALAMLAGNLAIYLPGLAWLALFYAGPGQAYIADTGASGPLGAAFAAGFLPFVFGDLLKVMLAAAILPLVWRAAMRRRR
ncbi:MAG: biotin transporter BioY [Rhodospirillales bacterium]|nr:biotin transporter BioY [Rhodospirillales bacterium]MDH3912338.1 biotin transporter BioY [Rhodospirillales bacterium]MDH3967730.1 biotin transporter BioY [Rhodospirillales bacterium]